MHTIHVLFSFIKLLKRVNSFSPSNSLIVKENLMGWCNSKVRVNDRGRAPPPRRLCKPASPRGSWPSLSPDSCPGSGPPLAAASPRRTHSLRQPENHHSKIKIDEEQVTLPPLGPRVPVMKEEQPVTVRSVSRPSASPKPQPDTSTARILSMSTCPIVNTSCASVPA